MDGSTVTAMRISRPSVRESASTTIGRSLLSRTSLVNSLGAATRAVSSTIASGRVRETNARCWAVIPSSPKESSARVHTSVRSRSSATLPSVPSSYVVVMSRSVVVACSPGRAVVPGSGAGQGPCGGA